MSLTLAKNKDGLPIFDIEGNPLFLDETGTHPVDSSGLGFEVQVDRHGNPLDTQDPPQPIKQPPTECRIKLLEALEGDAKASAGGATFNLAPEQENAPNEISYHKPPSESNQRRQVLKPLSTANAKQINKPRQMDVLFGKGSGPSNHEGNIRFRQLVAERKYAHFVGSNKIKLNLALDIVSAVKKDGGRFLQRLDNLPKGHVGYKVVDDDTALQKAKQALRNATRELKSSKTTGTITTSDSTDISATNGSNSNNTGNNGGALLKENKSVNYSVPSTTASASAEATVATLDQTSTIDSDVAKAAKGLLQLKL